MLGLRSSSLGLLLALFLLTEIHRSAALRCDCRQVECEPLDPKSCPAGVGRYFCGCCDRCLKAENEECGGAFNVNGKCGKGLQCDNKGDQNASGICRKTILFPH